MEHPRVGPSAAGTQRHPPRTWGPAVPTVEPRDPPVPLALRGIVRTFPDGHSRRVVLDGIDLEMTAGELVALMGPSGSGKTTLLRIAAGLDRPDRGEVHVAGSALSTLRATDLAAVRRESIGYVEQRWNLLDSLTVLENVALPLELTGMRSRDATDAGVEALGSVGLTQAARQFPSELSGGEQQRAAVARALVGSRRLLLADEPTGALDAITAESVMRVIRRHCDDRGAAVLLATHDPAISGWADRVVFLRNGKLSERSATGPGR